MLLKSFKIPIFCAWQYYIIYLMNLDCLFFTVKCITVQTHRDGIRKAKAQMRLNSERDAKNKKGFIGT